MFNSLNNKNSIYNFKKVIDDVINANLDNRGLVKYISAVVVSINDNNTVNVYIPPDNKNTITGIVNKCGEILQAGDSVELCTKNGSVKNSWVAIKHGRDVSGAISDNFPIGSIIYYGGTELPNNWFFCDGRAISRTAYPELFSRFGTTYGEGDGNTTFNLPDMRGKVGVGLDTTDTDFNTLGKIGGSKYLQKHKHTMTSYYDDANYNHGIIPSEYGHYSLPHDGGGIIRHHYTDEEGTGESGNLQPYTVVNYIVKVSNSFSYIDVSKSSVINNLTNTSITDALSANMGKELNEKINLRDNIIVLRQNNLITWSASQTPSHFDFLTKDYQRGNLLSVDSTGIVTIGEGVSLVKVFVHVNKNEDDFPSNYLMGYIRKNGSGLVRSITNCGRWSQLNTELVFSVQEGDTIDYAISSDKSGELIFPTYSSFTYNIGMNTFIIQVLG